MGAPAGYALLCTEPTWAIWRYRAMEMTFWLPEAEAELARLAGVPSKTQAGG
jgi:hypothetical protein